MRAFGATLFSNYLQSYCWWLSGFLLIPDAERELACPSSMKSKVGITLKKKKKRYNALPPISRWCFSFMTACLHFLIKSLSSDVPNKTTTLKGLVDAEDPTQHSTYLGEALPDALSKRVPMPKKPIDFKRCIKGAVFLEYFVISNPEFRFR